MTVFLVVLIAGLAAWFVTECVEVRNERRRDVRRPISRRALREMNVVDEDFWTGGP